jgi:hypothetical protein
MHQGNLRESGNGNRYSSLFPNQKISYWADTITTARKEVKNHHSGNNLITFRAYDDASSFIPILGIDEPLKIIDGRDSGFTEILQKNEKGKPLSRDERRFLREIMIKNPDCLAYWSVANQGGVNFIFFEKGFKKLALRGVQLRLGDYPGKNHNHVACAISSDYMPVVKNYGKCFQPLAKVSFDKNYLRTKEYKDRQQAWDAR